MTTSWSFLPSISDLWTTAPRLIADIANYQESVEWSYKQSFVWF